MEEVIYPLYSIRAKLDSEYTYVNSDGSLAFMGATNYAVSYLFNSSGVHEGTFILREDVQEDDDPNAVRTYVTSEKEGDFIHFGNYRARLPRIDGVHRRYFVPIKVNGYQVEFASRNDLVLNVRFDSTSPVTVVKCDPCSDDFIIYHDGEMVTVYHAPEDGVKKYVPMIYE